MIRALVWGLGCGAAIQGFRNFPSDGPLQADSVSVLFVLGLVAAFFAGRSRRHSSSSATATATAVAVAESASVATNTVNVALVVPGQGARHTGITVPDMESVSWMGQERLAVTQEDLDGADYLEVAESAGHVEVDR